MQKVYFNGLLERCCERFLDIYGLKAVHEISDYNSDDVEEGVVKQHAPAGSKILHDARMRRYDLLRPTHTNTDIASDLLDRTV